MAGSRDGYKQDEVPVNDAKKDIIHVTLPINVNLTAGLFVGFTVGVGFHPIDKAFYLRGTEKLKVRQHYFASKYWENPFLGLRSTFYQRLLSSSVFFSLQGEFTTRWYPILRHEQQWSDKTAKFFVSSGAGFFTGIIANALYALKYYTYQKGRGGPLENAIEMWKQGGPRPFIKGIYAGAGRDTGWGAGYGLGNAIADQYIDKIPEENSTLKTVAYVISRFINAGFATAAVSPLNYVRNMQFNSKAHEKQPHGMDLICDAWLESKKAVKATLKKEMKNGDPSERAAFPRASFFQKKFMVGVGTGRAAAQVAAGQALYDYASKRLRAMDEKQEKRSLLPNSNR